MTRFRLHQDVAVVEYRDDEPAESPQDAPRGFVRAVEGNQIRVLYFADHWEAQSDFSAESGEMLVGLQRLWRKRNANHARVFPVCHRAECEAPVLGEPVTDRADPLHREWCSVDCQMADAGAAEEMRNRGAW